MRTETAISWIFRDDTCDKMAKGATKKAAVNPTIVIRSMTSASGSVMVRPANDLKTSSSIPAFLGSIQ